MLFELRDVISKRYATNPIELRQYRAKEVFKLYRQVIKFNNKTTNNDVEYLGNGIRRIKKADGTTIIKKPMTGGFF